MVAALLNARLGYDQSTAGALVTLSLYCLTPFLVKSRIVILLVRLGLRIEHLVVDVIVVIEICILARILESLRQQR